MGQGDKLQGTGLFSLGLHWSAHDFLSWVDFALIGPQLMLYFECLTSILSGVWSGFKVSREQEPAQDELTEEEVEKETIAK